MTTCEHLDERVEARIAKFTETCRELGILMSGDGRVSEADAAALLVMSRGHLKALRQQGNGPSCFYMPMNGARVTYDLKDLAQWVEQARDEAENDS